MRFYLILLDKYFFELEAGKMWKKTLFTPLFFLSKSF